jgi:hypothetical protein
MILFSGAFNAQEVRKLTFDGKLSEIKLDIKNLNPVIALELERLYSSGYGNEKFFTPAV